MNQVLFKETGSKEAEDKAVKSWTVDEEKAAIKIQVRRRLNKQGNWCFLI